MPAPHISTPADPRLVQAWVRGWTLSRGTPPPEPSSGGWKVVVGLPEQHVRYVFPAFSPEVIRHLAPQLAEPWSFLKICATAETVAAVLPANWTIQPPEFLMTGPCAALGEADADAFYSVHLEENGPVLLATMHDKASGGLAASGRAALTNGCAMFDQIVTDPAHRRRGLGRRIMTLLGAAAAERRATQGVLVATADGHALYSALGWSLHSPYTSAVNKPDA